MSERSTEELIRRLARDVAPVRRPPRPGVALACVAAAWLLAAAYDMHATGSAARMARAVPWSLVGYFGTLVGLLIAAVGATLAALAAAIPGRGDAVRRGSAAALAGIAIAALGGLQAAFAAGLDSPARLVAAAMCTRKAALLGALPALMTAGFVLWGVGRKHLATAFSLLLGAAAFGAAAGHVVCRAGGAWHLLLGHALAPVAAALVLSLPVSLLLRLRSAWG